MGSTSFYAFATGESAEQAFRRAADEARHEHGHGGYTGTIAEKHDFVTIPVPISEVARVKAILVEAGEKNIARIQDAPLKSFSAELYISDEADRASKLQAAREKLEQTRSAEGLTRAIAKRYASGLLNEGDPRIDDRFGPAGCIVLCDPEVVKPLSKAVAERLAKERHGPKARVEIQRGGGRTTAVLCIVEERAAPAHMAFGRLVTTPENYTRVLATESGKDADDARGRLFARKGEYLFFGRASE